MNSSNFQPDVQTLQNDVASLLQQIIDLVNSASQVLKSDGDQGNKYSGFLQQIKKEKSKVEELQLVMAIVAPMKAGKSTIVNAIIGQNLLPSRNAAMTTLPTEIVLKSDIAEPVLYLSFELLKLFRDAVVALQRIISQKGDQWGKQKLSEHPHLLELLEKIVVGTWGFSIQEQTQGRDEIIQTLTDLNDVIRLCTLIDPNLDPLRSIRDVPQIQTPFVRSQLISQSEKMGNLVIVDTPGPNEAGEHHRLANVVAEQLRQCSIVLIVLDFTQLRTKAAEDIRQEVQKMIELRGKENLYVLINRIDQRKEGDMTTEEVRQLVSSQFHIGSAGETNRVFEISALRAFRATNFLLEFEQNPTANISEMETAKELAQQAFGDMWEVVLPSATIDQMNKASNIVWGKSGFAPFLEKAIKALMESAAPRCMRSALNLSRSRLKQLQDDVKLRRGGVLASEKELQAQIVALSADLDHLENCRTRLKQVDQIKARLNQQIREILKQLSSSEPPYEALQKFGGESSKSFSYYSSAESFQGEIETLIVNKINSLLDEVRDETKKQVERSRKELLKLLERETQPIIEAAQKRLNQGFDISLSFQPPKISAGEIGLVKPRRGSVETKTRYWDEKEYYTEYETVYERRWYSLWLWKHEKEVPVTKSRTKTKSEDYYVVSKSDVVSRFKDSIQGNAKQIQQKIDQYIENEFQKQIDLFFENLDAYLSSYRNSLRQAQQDQTLATEKKQQLVSTLESLVPKAEEQIKQAEIYLRQTDKLMND